MPLLPPLYTIIDSSYVKPTEAAKTASALISGGARIIQLRGKGLPSGELLRAARAVKEVTSKHNVTLIINDRVDIALLVDAGGVHLGQDDLPPVEARRLLGPGKIIGYSTHNAAEVKAAEKLPVDYISFGPIFKTPTKADADRPKGIEELKKVNSTLPITAIGGITEGSANEVLSAGAASVAIINDILSSDDIASKVASIIKSIK